MSGKVKSASSYWGNISNRDNNSPITTNPTDTSNLNNTYDYPGGDQASAAIAAHARMPAFTAESEFDPSHRTAAAEDKQTTKDIDSRYKDIYDQAVSKDPEEIYSEQNKNIAKGEDKDGNLNQKSFDDTMRLSREADYYNNRPTDTEVHVINGGRNGVTVQAVKAYDRPNIETQEMRQMREAERLDENRKKQKQELQADVDKLPYDFWKDYNEDVREDAADLRRELLQLSNTTMQNKQHQISAENLTRYQEFLRFFIEAEKANIIIDCLRMGNTVMATLLTYLFTNGTVITDDDMNTSKLDMGLQIVSKVTGISTNEIKTNPARRVEAGKILKDKYNSGQISVADFDKWKDIIDSFK